MRRAILAGVSVLALAMGGATVGFAADGLSTPNPGADMPATSGAPQHGTNAGATTPAPYGVTTNEQGGMNLPSGDIRQAQEQLRDQGLYHGRIDGVLGPETKQALQQFQQKNGLPVTATLDQQTMDKLAGNAGAGQGSSMPPSSNQGGSTNLGDHTAPKH